MHGSNGEFVHLCDQEKLEFFTKAKSYAKEGRLMIAGVGCNSTLATLRMCTDMATAGADAALVVAPFYYKSQMTKEVLYNYYKEVADNSPIPVILYNVPVFTSIDLSAELIISLSEHPNIIGCKESNPDIAKITALASCTKANKFQLLAGSASFLLPAYSVGAVGGICALASVLGEEVCELHTTYQQGNLEAARALQYRLVAPNAAVTKRFGMAGLKFAMDCKGYYGGKPRRPLLPLTESDQKSLRGEFVNNGFLLKSNSMKINNEK